MKTILEPFKSLTTDLKKLADSCQEKFEKGFASPEEKDAFFRELGARAADYMDKTKPEKLPPADPKDKEQQKARAATEGMLAKLRGNGLLDYGVFFRAIEIGNRHIPVKDTAPLQNENGKAQTVPVNSTVDPKSVGTDKVQPTLVSSSTDQMSFVAENKQQDVKQDAQPKREKKGFSVLVSENRDSMSFVVNTSEKKEEARSNAPKNNAPKKGYQNLSLQSTDSISYAAPEQENNSRKRRFTYTEVVNKEAADKKDNTAGKKAEERRIMQEREKLEREKKENENSIKRSNTMKK